MKDWLTLIVLAAGLSMDAFAVSLCKGLTVKRIDIKKFAFAAGVFAVMQGIMPLIGYLFGSLFLEYIDNYLGIVSFVILLLVGGKMIYEGIKTYKNKAFDGEAVQEDKAFSVSAVLIQGVATSIDALAVGVSLLNFSINIYVSAPVISGITFPICMAGMFLGFKFGSALKAKNGLADILGGILLAAIGISFLFAR
ncbi:MAG: manganese efflux pump MntP family protein [Clostridiales bacterium]|jgi:putative Mn2+ efflux pump MntP|nr:manganese efflux pump MntP family protein [Clostridiales bacterium]